MPTAKRINREYQKGTYVIWVLVLIPVLVGGMALIFNAGSAFATHEQARTAADAAALAGAMAVKRERSYLESTNTSIKAAAKARVEAAAREAAGGKNNFAHDGSKTIITVQYPPVDAIYDPYNQSAINSNYIAVRVSKQSDNLLAINDMFGLIAPVSAIAIARVGEGGANERCPGIYVYGKNIKKATDIKHDSDLKILNGGIYVYGDDNAALSGSAKSTVEGQWIELGDGGNFPKSVTYYCEKYPGGSPDCVEAVSPREPIEEPPETACTSTNSNCCIYQGKFKCGCNSCDSKEFSKCTTSELPLQAGRYCGLIITKSNSVVLMPSATTDYFDLRQGKLNGKDTWGGLEITSSVVSLAKSGPYQGVKLFANNASLIVGDGNKTKSTLTGIGRVYFNSIEMDDDSLVELTSFDEAGCGKALANTTVIVL